MQTHTGNFASTDSKLKEFFIDQLQDIYWAEKKLVKTLPKLEDAATSQELKNAFSSHLEQTKEHVSRLENVFNLLDIPADELSGLRMTRPSFVSGPSNRLLCPLRLSSHSITMTNCAF